ncbi:hypothetical protein JW998_05610 [candidate division KSB1 bacterium]|nr:hypothetical protein [candidate division KSB1 bacterium]
MSLDSNIKFLHVQRRRIEHDKWCEGCSIGRDPGSIYVANWIENYAGLYRMAWNNSLCKGCKHYRECGLQVLPACDRYDEY